MMDATGRFLLHPEGTAFEEDTYEYHPDPIPSDNPRFAETGVVGEEVYVVRRPYGLVWHVQTGYGGSTLTLRDLERLTEFVRMLEQTSPLPVLDAPG